MIKCLAAMLETWVQSLGWEDPVEKEMATHSSTLVWKIPWMEEPGRLQSMGSQSDTTEWLYFTMFKWLLKELSSSSRIHTYTDTRWLLAVWRRCIHFADWSQDRQTPSAEPSLPSCSSSLQHLLSSSASWMIFAVKSFLYSYFFLARLICPSACRYHSLQIHSYMVCWLTSSHQKAAVTIQIVHKSRHFARKRDSLQPSNIHWGHIFIWLSLEAPLSLIHVVLELYIRVDNKTT